MSNLSLWDKLKEVPLNAQKKIKGGRLSGMTDISPQWRYKVMTDTFGAVGFGWSFKIVDQWIGEGANNEKCAFTNIDLFIKVDDVWSDAIPGTGGSSFVAKEKNGLYTSDEAFKMSLTDALSVAMKVLGVGANIYSNGNDFTMSSKPVSKEFISEQQVLTLISMCHKAGKKESDFCKYLKVDSIDSISASEYKNAENALAQRGGK